MGSVKAKRGWEMTGQTCRRVHTAKIHKQQQQSGEREWEREVINRSLDVEVNNNTHWGQGPGLFGVDRFLPRLYGKNESREALSPGKLLVDTVIEPYPGEIRFKLEGRQGTKFSLLVRKVTLPGFYSTQSKF